MNRIPNPDTVFPNEYGTSCFLKNVITACTNVVNKYHKALVCGALDPETTLPQFNSELKDAGIDAIIEEKQAQLDAWLAEQK